MLYLPVAIKLLLFLLGDLPRLLPANQIPDARPRGFAWLEFQNVGSGSQQFDDLFVGAHKIHALKYTFRHAKTILSIFRDSGNNRSMKNFKFFTLGASALALVALSGCGAASLVNSVIPEIDDLAALNGTSVEATVGSSRAVISATVTKTSTFPDRDLPQKNVLKRLKLRQSLNQRVSVTFASGVTPPATFTLKNLALNVKLSDGDGARSVESSASVAGPLTFAREGKTSVYTLSGPVEVSNIAFDGAKFTAIRDIITTAPSPNAVTARFSLDAEDTELPRGTVIRFALENGKAKVEI